MPERLLTPDEVALLLAVSLRSVRRWTKQGRLKGIKVGRVFRYRPDDVKLAMDVGVKLTA